MSAEPRCRTCGQDGCTLLKHWLTRGRTMGRAPNAFKVEIETWQWQCPSGHRFRTHASRHLEVQA